MSLLKKLAGETAIYGVSSILSRILNYIILTPYLTRIFDGPEKDQYGIHGLMYAFAALILVLFTYRMETAFFRFGSKEGMLGRTFSTASFSLLLTSVLFVAGFIFFSEDIADILTDGDANARDQRFVIWFIIIIGLDALAALPFAKLRLENRPLRFASIKILNIFVNAGFILFFLELVPLLQEFGFSWASNIYDANKKLDYVFLANLVGSAFTLLLLIPEYRKLRLVFDKALFKKMLWYAGPLIIVGIAGVINQLSDRFWLKELLPGTYDENMDQVGVYNACVKVAVLMSLFIQAFNYAVEPFFFKNADRKDAKDIYAQVGQAFTLVGSVVFLGIMLFLDWVKILIDEDYWEGLIVVMPLLLAYLFLGLYYNFSIWFKLKDKTHIGGYIAVGGSIITLSINFLLIPRIGYLGSALAAMSCYFFMAVASYLIGKRYYPIPYRIGRMLLYIGLAILAYLGSTQLEILVDQPSLWLSTGVNLLILLAYLGGIYSLEKNTIRELLAGK